MNGQACTEPARLDLADRKHYPAADLLIIDTHTRHSGGLPAQDAAKRDSPATDSLNTPEPPIVSARLQPGDNFRAELPADAGSSITLPVQFPLSLHDMPKAQSLNVRDPQVVEFIAGSLSQYAHASRLMGGRELVDLAVRHIRFLYSGVADAHGQRRSNLLAICSRYAEFIGWLFQDLGDPVISLFWTDRALEWAQESALNGSFTSYVLMRKSDHAEQYGTPDRVLALARAALSISALSPKAQVLVLQQEARGHSQSGESKMFERKLDEARRLIENAQGDGEAPWGDYCDMTHLSMQEASGRVELGQFDQAIDIIERGLPRMTPIDRLDSTVFRAKLARAYAEAGYRDRAVDVASEACVDAGYILSFRAFAELARVYDVVAPRDNSDKERHFASSFAQLKANFSRRVRQSA